MATMILKEEDLTQEGRETPMNQLTRRHLESDVYTIARYPVTTLIFIRGDDFVVFIPPDFTDVCSPRNISYLPGYLGVKWQS